MKLVKIMRFTFMCRDKPESIGIKVAIIGAGPAGLSAAGYLVCHGYDVNVYDKLPLPGGLMIFAIPPWRVSREAVMGGIRELEEKFGVEFILRTKVYSGTKPVHEEGDEFVEKTVPLEQLLEEYDAILITTGTWRSRIPRIPGVEAKGVYTALEYVYQHRLYELGIRKEPPHRGEKVIVIGGGYSAVDAAEQAFKNGAETYLVYRRTVKQAPAGLYEIERIRRLGVNVIELASPVEVIVENGVAKGVKFQRMKLGPPDESGRPRPIPIPGSEFTLEADTVIFATGERSTPPLSPEDKEALEKLGIELTKWNTIVVNNNMRTGNPKVFAAGDVVNGPSKLGPAVGSGLRAARSLDYWMRARRLKLMPLPRS